MGRCGCNDEITVVQAGHGIHVDETVEGHRTTYTVNFDGTSVVGDGVLWDQDGQRLHAKLRATNPGLAFDGTGGLYVTNPGDGDGAAGYGVSVADLEARRDRQDVVGGVWGAGYLIKPQSTRGSYQYGVERGTDALHVPVRMLSDGTPVVTPDEFLGLQNGDLPREHVQDQDIHRWRVRRNEPGIWLPELTGITGGDEWLNHPQQGWFGYLEPNEPGLLTLGDVFSIVGRNTVLILELLFPAFNRDAMTWEYPTPPERVETFLRRVLVLIQRHGLADSVVVTTPTPTVPDSTTDGRPVLDLISNGGVRCGPVIGTEDQAEDLPAEKWDPRWTWAVLDYELTNEVIQRYTRRPDTFVLLSTITRHYQHHTKTVPTGALGVLSADPEYTAGQHLTHPTAGNWAYRKRRSTWHHNTIEHGLLPPITTIDRAGPAHRGLLRRSDEPAPYGLGPAAWLDGTPYYVLQGYLCPIPAESYTLEFHINPLTIPAAGYAAVAFGVNTDHAFANWADAPDPSGYIVTYDANRRLALHSWDEATGRIIERAGVPAAGGDDNWKRIHIVVSPTDLRVRFLNYGTGDVVAEIPGEQDAPEWATQWRGRYVYLGRYAPEPTNPAVCQFANLAVINTA